MEPPPEATSSSQAPSPSRGADPFDEGGDEKPGWRDRLFGKKRRTRSSLDELVREGSEPPPPGTHQAAVSLNHPDLDAILDQELGVEREVGAAAAADGFNPLEQIDDVLRRARGAYMESNNESRGPLQVADDPHLQAARAKANGEAADIELLSARRSRWRRYLTRRGREENAQYRAAQQIHRNLPELTTLMVVRIQRTWRGYITRKTIEQVRAQGGKYEDFEVKRIVRSSLYHGRKPHIADVPYRVLPLSCFGAWWCDEWDDSPYYVSNAVAAQYFAVQNAEGDYLCGLIFLAFAWLATLILTYLIPSWMAVVLDTIFYDGENSATIERLAGWVMVYTILTMLCAGILFLVIVYRETLFHNQVDFVLAVVGLKKGRLVTMSHLQELRGEDLGVTCKAIYRDFVFMVMHFMHVVLGWFTLLFMDAAFAFASFLAIVIYTVMTTMYDAHLGTQMAIEVAVSKREGLVYQKARQGSDADCTQRNYQLGMSKTVLTMSQSFGRFHGIVLGTAATLCAVTPLLFLAHGGKAVRSERYQLHTMVLCLLYTAFTLYSFYKFNQNYSSYVLAKRAMRRVFKVAYHFKRFSEERTFKETECKIIGQAEGVKELRDQPRSWDLFAVFAVGTFVMLLFFVGLVVRGDGGGNFACGNQRMLCAAENPPWIADWADDEAVMKVGGEAINITARAAANITVGFEFSMFHGCRPTDSTAALLQLCGAALLNRAKKRRHVDTTKAAAYDDFAVTLFYPGWRGDVRIASKDYSLRHSASLLKPEPGSSVRGNLTICPAYYPRRPDQSPWTSGRRLLPKHPTLLDASDERPLHDEYPNVTCYWNRNKNLKA
eukprot:TRINITY_DN13482_c0_g1_i1.p1 TRINITY_DN13482_c0_g1~~TRINITY_DN13482_c0_g1_i1.p1  ORF type:complete len:833 (+),score=302.82 TRINITY_DN13482_c0_g1_i1:50-2548(+)